MRKIVLVSLGWIGVLVLSALHCWAQSTSIVALTSGGLSDANGVVLIGQPIIGLTQSTLPDTVSHIGFIPAAVGSCPADYDGNGMHDVPDIFTFLTAWFAGEPAAYSFGGTPGVPAIFAFLTAWFAGCP